MIKTLEDVIVSHLTKVSGLDLPWTSESFNLSHEFIEALIDEIDWNNISYSLKLSEQFIKDFQNRVNWKTIFAYQKLSEDFIEEFQDKVDWDEISCYQNLSEEFIEKFQDRVNWSYISKHQKLSENFIERWQEKEIINTEEILSILKKWDNVNIGATDEELRKIKPVLTIYLENINMRFKNK